MKDTPLSDLLRQDRIKTENQLMELSDSSWQDFPDIGISTGAYIIFNEGGTIYHGTYVTGPVSQSSAESEYNAACTTGMDLAHFRMLIHEFLNKVPYLVTEESPLIIMDSKSDFFMDKNGKYTKHTSHIYRRVKLVSNSEKCKMYNIDWCEGGLKLADIANNNVCENYLNPRMKYFMVRLDN